MHNVTGLLTLIARIHRIATHVEIVEDGDEGRLYLIVKLIREWAGV